MTGANEFANTEQSADKTSQIQASASKRANQETKIHRFLF